MRRSSCEFETCFEKKLQDEYPNQLEQPATCSEDGTLESEQDDYNEGTSDASGTENKYSSNNMQEKEHIDTTDELPLLPDDKDIENIDWERFYFTVDLVNITFSSITDADNYNVQTGSMHQGDKLGNQAPSVLENKEGWKKRLVLLLPIGLYVSFSGIEVPFTCCLMCVCRRRVTDGSKREAFLMPRGWELLKET